MLVEGTLGPAEGGEEDPRMGMRGVMRRRELLEVGGDGRECPGLVGRKVRARWCDLHYG